MKKVKLVLFGCIVMATSCKKDSALDYANKNESEIEMKKSIRGKWELVEVNNNGKLEALPEAKVLFLEVGDDFMGFGNHKGWINKVKQKDLPGCAKISWDYNASVSKLIISWNGKEKNNYEVVKINKNELILKGIQILAYGPTTLITHPIIMKYRKLAYNKY